MPYGRVTFGPRRWSLADPDSKRDPGTDQRRACCPFDGQLAAIDAWWRACNYLTAGQIYLKDNPLLERPLMVDDIKPRLLGRWGTSPGLSFIYAHMSRLIDPHKAIYMPGPGNGGTALFAASWSHSWQFASCASVCLSCALA